jgi:hypothetical protein
VLLAEPVTCFKTAADQRHGEAPYQTALRERRSMLRTFTGVVLLFPT